MPSTPCAYLRAGELCRSGVIAERWRMEGRLPISSRPAVVAVSRDSVASMRPRRRAQLGSETVRC
jgi:hypothetical protein